MRIYLMAILLIILAGCTGTAPGTAPGIIPSGPIDCKDDGACITRAIDNNCQDAFMEERVNRTDYIVNSRNMRVTVSNERAFCRVKMVQTDAEGKLIADVQADFRLPLEKCSSNDDPQSYVTTEGKCSWMEFE